MQYQARQSLSRRFSIACSRLSPIRSAAPFWNGSDGEDLLVSQLAEPFSISLQAVSRHIQVLVKAGFVTQERTGRISRCRLDAGPIYQAAVWINRYSKYWQSQFETQAAWNQIELGKAAPARRTTPRMQPKRRPLRR